MTDSREPLRAWLDLLGASTAIKKGLDARMRKQFGLSLARFDVLAALHRAGADGLSAGGISEHLKVTEGNTTQVTAPLVKDGLVVRMPSAEDGRVAIFQMTTKGRRLFERTAEANRRWVAEAFADLAPNDLKTLRRLLSALKSPKSASQEQAA